jgi:two-component system LytT family response regulator
MTIKAMIIDDEPFARDDLRYMLAEHPEVEVKWEAGRIDEARRLLEENTPDVVFLDIQLRGGSGFDLIAGIDPQKTSYIFVTALEECLPLTHQTDAIDCLTKPVMAPALAESLQKLKHKTAV